MKAILHLFSLSLLISILPIVEFITASQNDKNPQVIVEYNPYIIKGEMYNSTKVDFTIYFNKTTLKPDQYRQDNLLIVDFYTEIISPEMNIIEFDENQTIIEDRDKYNKKVIFKISQLEEINYTYKSSMNLKFTYVGHASIKHFASINEGGDKKFLNKSTVNDLKITITKKSGVLDDIFLYSVIVFITISYINLGVQIDMDHLRTLFHSPKVVFYGYLIGVFVMPGASWIAGFEFFERQPMYRIGSFIYACGPAASASVLWTVMFDSDKELSLGLQIVSTLGALITMPISLYMLINSFNTREYYHVVAPYRNLARTLIVLLFALFIGRMIGYNKRAKQISQKIFRPLTMFVLLFIIIFSSITYWYVYQMFNWNITKMALTVTSITYILSGLLGYSINMNLDHMIAISISSTYRNSGIAFAALVVAFEPPDVFIAYVPCLTQVVTTSLIGLVLYSIKILACNRK